MSSLQRPVFGLLLSLSTVVAAAGCASTGHTMALGQPITLQPGERVVLPDDAALRYIAVTADSRCPPDVQCIHAGDADVAFEFFQGDGASRTITLNTAGAPAAAIGEWRLRLLSLEFGPSPGAAIRVDDKTR
jgi:hypothetical protein